MFGRFTYENVSAETASPRFDLLQSNQTPKIYHLLMFDLNRACGEKIILESFEDLQILLKLTDLTKTNKITCLGRNWPQNKIKKEILHKKCGIF